jgi:hypothetical protein
LLRKVKNRAVGEPSNIAFAALSHCDDVITRSGAKKTRDLAWKKAC